MEKQLKVFEKLLEQFKQDSGIQGVLLTGSVARGVASSVSDLDVIVLCDRDQFVNQTVDDVVVEIHYHTYETMMERLETRPMAVYFYLFAKIAYDNGKLQEIIDHAWEKYHSYVTPYKEKHGIFYWLSATKIKLTYALEREDLTLLSYYTSTNTWKFLEGMWAVNNKAMPPAGLTYYMWSRLEEVPSKDWFERIMVDSIRERGKAMLEMLDWMLPRLEENSKS